MNDTEDEVHSDGFLDDDHTVTMTVAAAKVEAFQAALAQMQWRADATNVEPLPDGRSVVKVTYRAGTPDHVFKKVVARLEKLEHEHT